ncbi:MAG TPA: hypothetical protein VIJ14_04930 [Rhabdochlamydiaceae bacterium]
MTSDEFQNKFWAKFPNSWVNIDFDGGITTIRMSFDMIGTTISFAEKDRLAIAIWRAGIVIKDDSGTFFPVVAPTVQAFTQSGAQTFTLPNSHQGSVVWKPAFAYVGGGTGKAEIVELISDGTNWGEFKTKKCECGASSVGSSKHSGWCEMNND